MHSIGGRLRAWREGEKLSQKDAATQLRVPARTYQDYERDLRAPGAESMEAFVRAGINANWLLTGEGPMLLADLVEMGQLRLAMEQRDELAKSLQAALEKSFAAPSCGPKVTINAKFLAAMLRGILQEGAPLEKACEGAAQFYMQAIQSGMITADGKVGSGGEEAA